MTLQFWKKMIRKLTLVIRMAALMKMRLWSRDQTLKQENYLEVSVSCHETTAVSTFKYSLNIPLSRQQTSQQEANYF